MVRRFLFPFNLFLGAFLLFSIQPMAAKALLPIYGGTPGTWTVCMLFFQGVLLSAYAYVSLFPIINKIKLWSLLHLSLIGASLLTLPILFQPLMQYSLPEINILYNLLIQLGLPLLIVGASAPLLQFLYSQTTNKGASDPYFLYSASNLGSLIALLVYPLFIERFIGLANQFRLWSLLYLIYCLILTALFFLFSYQPLTNNKKTKSWSWHSLLVWFSLSFIPCSLMLGVSLYITTDIAATPLFWVIPLILYLLSFIISFTNKPLSSLSWVNDNTPIFVGFILLGFLLGNKQSVLQGMIFNLVGFFIIALACHRTLYLKRPPPQELTLFYLCLALGGVSAGIANGLLAPHLFNQVYEYPITLVLSMLIIPLAQSKSKWWVSPIVLGLLIAPFLLPSFKIAIFTSYDVAAIFGIVLMVLCFKNQWDLTLAMILVLFFIFWPKEESHLLQQVRNFYGVKRVTEKENLHLLFNHSTAHGLQIMNEARPQGITTYYGVSKTVVELMQANSKPLTATLVGLGVGTILCQFRPQDQVNVVEIDPQVIDLANNPTLFTYTRDCPTKRQLINNDGRLAIEQLKDGSQNIIILDAFSGDAIPIHLLTLEAFTLYKQKLATNGVILINLSNQYLDLLSVINAISQALGFHDYFLITSEVKSKQQYPSEWALLTNNEHLIRSLQGRGWDTINSQSPLLWTDNYSNIIPALKWQR